MSAALPPPGNGGGIGLSIAQFFDRILNALEDGLKVQTKLLIQGRRNGARIHALTQSINRQAEAAERGRDAAVEDLKEHVTIMLRSELAASTRWERRFLIVVGILIVLSNLVGQPVGQLLEKIFKFTG